VAQEQQQWAQAEEYYQTALAIYTELNDRYEQAGTYYNLGVAAQAQQQWAEARDFLLKGLAITVEIDEDQGRTITLGSLASLWRASSDPDLLVALASILSMTPREVKKQLSALLSEGDKDHGPCPV
jgi:tetratricopeptide (TPR) repeat protein